MVKLQPRTPYSLRDIEPVHQRVARPIARLIARSPIQKAGRSSFGPRRARRSEPTQPFLQRTLSASTLPEASWSSSPVMEQFPVSRDGEASTPHALFASRYRTSPSEGRSADRSVDRSVARSLDRLIAWSPGRSVDRSIGRSLGRSVVRSVARSLGRSFGSWVARSN